MRRRSVGTVRAQAHDMGHLNFATLSLLLLLKQHAALFSKPQSEKKIDQYWQNFEPRLLDALAESTQSRRGICAPYLVLLSFK